MTSFKMIDASGTVGLVMQPEGSMVMRMMPNNCIMVMLGFPVVLAAWQASISQIPRHCFLTLWLCLREDGKGSIARSRNMMASRDVKLPVASYF